MPSLAEQIATLESDHTAALALIDTLKAEKAALMSANSSLLAENTTLVAQYNDMRHYVDDARTMAEHLASSALDMLRASRRQVGTPAEVIPFAPKGPFSPALQAKIDGEKLLAAGTRTPEPPAQQAVAEIMAGDSGDETDVDHEIDKAETDLGVTLSPDERASAKAAVLDVRRHRTVPPINAFKPVDRDAEGRPMMVTHDRDGLPIFLKRDTTFAERGQVFA
ncbi:MAG: hypothetical protein ACXWLZ_06880 [Rhizomicrobium sp.]